MKDTENLLIANESDFTFGCDPPNNPLGRFYVIIGVVPCVAGVVTVVIRFRKDPKR